MASLAVVFHGCDVFSNSEGAAEPAFSEEEINSGGETTVFKTGNSSFSNPAPNLHGEALETHLAGDAHFEAAFVTAPSKINGGLGPLFNNNTCISCHVDDGRGKPFFSNGRISSVLVRLSLNDGTPGEPIPVPGYGFQLQNRSVFGVEAEATVEVSYEFFTETLADGTEVELRKPTYTLVDPYRTLPANVSLSVRTAPPVFGAGLLDAIPPAQIMRNADPDDSDGDGISGKPNLVFNEAKNQLQLGRFGWKANQPTLEQQVAAAYNQDMGITSPYFPKENIFENPEVDDGLDDDPEITQQRLDETVFYTATLGVPAKRNTENPIVAQGKKLFKQAGCQSCHVPRFTTMPDAEIEAVADQVIFPYTDLLLHDMGEGLADNRSDFDASGREWRTPPLWGIGLVPVVNGHQSFMHDGRARGILEAILWHGGEAEQAKIFVKELSKSEREALIAFVKSI